MSKQNNRIRRFNSQESFRKNSAFYSFNRFSLISASTRAPLTKTQLKLIPIESVCLNIAVVSQYVDLGHIINLGRLKNYSGAQRYPIPDAIDLRNYQSVVIWCRMANATFGYALLQSTRRASIQ